MPQTNGYHWGGFKPWPHQKEAFDLSHDKEGYALLMEQRTGKTGVIIHTAAYLKASSEITGVLIVCPNTVKSVWREQFEEHAPDWLDLDILVWRSKEKPEAIIKAWSERASSLAVLIMNEESLSTDRGQRAAVKWLSKFNCLTVIDESTSICNPKAKRTKFILRLRALSAYRRILTGTPVTKSPLDLWAPFHFLDPEILGYKSWFAMRNRHAIMGGFKGKEVLGYLNLDQITKAVEPHAYRILRRDVKDMPDKVFSRLYVTLDTEQRLIYDAMRDEMLAKWDDKELEVVSVLTQLCRLQQITGGFVPADGEPVAALPGTNPKLRALLDYIKLDGEGSKTVIFARYRAELSAIAAALREEYGDASTVEFHGGVSEKDKEENIRLFQRDPGTRFFVANQSSARMGIDLSMSNLVLWYSNTFALLDRLQAEDRTETLISAVGATTHVDIIAEDTLDMHVVDTLRSKRKLSDLVTGDIPLESWI